MPSHDTESVLRWRREIVEARIRLADPGLPPRQRQELWQSVDCREWFLKVTVDDFHAELEQIDRAIEARLRVVAR